MPKQDWRLTKNIVTVSSDSVTNHVMSVDDVVVMVVGDGTVTVKLPEAAQACGRVYYIHNVDGATLTIEKFTTDGTILMVPGGPATSVTDVTVAGDYTAWYCDGLYFFLVVENRNG